MYILRNAIPISQQFEDTYKENIAKLIDKPNQGFIFLESSSSTTHLRTDIHNNTRDSWIEHCTTPDITSSSFNADNVHILVN